MPIDEIKEFFTNGTKHEFALFGSLLRDDFNPESDIDILVNFALNAKRRLSVTLSGEGRS